MQIDDDDNDNDNDSSNVDGTVNIANTNDGKQARSTAGCRFGFSQNRGVYQIGQRVEATDSKLLPVSVLENQGLQESLEWLVTRLIYNKRNKKPEYK